MEPIASSDKSTPAVPWPQRVLKHVIGPVAIGEHRLTRQLTAIVEREGDGYVALCPEVDVASQGDSVAEARDYLQEALTLFFETASAEEVGHRQCNEVYVTHVEVVVG